METRGSETFKQQFQSDQGFDNPTTGFSGHCLGVDQASDSELSTLLSSESLEAGPREEAESPTDEDEETDEIETGDETTREPLRNPLLEPSAQFLFALAWWDSKSRYH